MSTSSFERDIVITDPEAVKKLIALMEQYTPAEPISDHPYSYQDREHIVALLRNRNDCENCAIAIEDRQPVVRCEDCKWSKPPVPGYDIGVNIICDKQNIYHPVDFFCADGVRK